MNFSNAELSIEGVKVGSHHKGTEIDISQIRLSQETLSKYTTIHITGRLENWKFTNKGRQLVGNIYSDRGGRFQDGTLIITSLLLPMSEQSQIPAEGFVMSTLNSHYHLGKRG